ncbi:MAG: ferrous iron transporter B [Candidatus Kapaibacterium sp.]
MSRSFSDTSARLIALVGIPNSGKTTLFNALTGMRQKVGNFPGITVEPKIAPLRGHEDSTQVIDLPGLYSLRAKSADEGFSIEVLTGEYPAVPKPDAVLFVIDGSNVEKGLTLFAQFAPLGIPSAVVVTMIDTIKAQGAVLDDIALERALGVPVYTVVGNKGLGVQELQEALPSPATVKIPAVAAGVDVNDHVGWARELCARVLSKATYDELTLKVDAWLLHPVLGGLVFLTIMTLFFVSIFSFAEPVMSAIESGIVFLQDVVTSNTADGLLRSFLNNGLMAGVGSVLVFLPQILLLVLFVTILEDCGYLARAAFIMDRIFGVFGLQGRSFIPLLGSFACAIPGIMSARMIPSDKDRMATIMIAPLMTCSARLPVYTLLIAAFVPVGFVWGFIPTQALVLAVLYGVAIIAGLVVAWVFRKTLFRSEKLHFLMEFPPYRLPDAKSVAMTLWYRGTDFVQSAGTVILTISLVLWVLSEFPRTDPSTMRDLSPAVASQVHLEQSYIGQIGKAIQPVFAPIGFDWKITVGILGSFAARETFVSVMGQMYATDTGDGHETLRAVLSSSMSMASAFSVLAFYIFALQCMSTIAIIRRETGSWKWSAVAFAYTFVLAYVSAYITFSLWS